MAAGGSGWQRVAGVRASRVLHPCMRSSQLDEEYFTQCLYSSAAGVRALLQSSFLAAPSDSPGVADASGLAHLRLILQVQMAHRNTLMAASEYIDIGGGASPEALQRARAEVAAAKEDDDGVSPPLLVVGGTVSVFWERDGRPCPCGELTARVPLLLSE